MNAGEVEHERDETDSLLLDWRTLVGFESSKAQFQRLLQQDSLSQVILFTGRDGIGKRLFIANCLGYIFCESQQACGQCPSCREVQRRSHAELLWLEAEKLFKLEDADSVQEHLSFQSMGMFDMHGSASRVVVLIDVEKLSLPAANRLLKTLEEPQSGSLILMSSSHPGQVLNTILSRCVRWPLQPPPRQQSLEWLRQQPGHEAFEDQELIDILDQHGLAPGAAHKYMSDVAAEDHVERQRILRSLLDAASVEQLLQASQELTKQRQMDANELANRLELILNQEYRQMVDEAYDTSSETNHRHPSGRLGRGSLCLTTLVRRRKVLRQLREFAVRKKIPLNAQLAADRLALTQFSND